MRVAAIDQGTTSTRILLAHGRGASPGANNEAPAEIKHALSHQQFYPHPGWVEQDPEELLGNIRRCLDAVGPVDALGIANQGESCLAWDRDTGAAISPVIVWQDSRTQDHIQQLSASGAESLTLARAGLPLDPYFSASKLGWMIKHIPKARELLKANRLCLGTTDAFFLHRLTGVYATDITTASRTSLMNLRTGTWDPKLCALFDVPLQALPEIRATTGHFGELLIDNKPVPVTASVVDQQASLYGHGCRKAGDIKMTFGTGAFALAVTGPEPLATATLPARARGLLPTVAWQGQGEAPVYAVDGGVYNAGSAINWAKDLGLFANLNDINAFHAKPAIDRGLAFVPALSGLGSPYWDRSAAGLWIGLSLEHKAEDLVQALLEGIAFRSAEVLEALGRLSPINRISIDGGLSRNAYFTRFLAKLSGHTITVQSFKELTAYGCAQLAAGDQLPPQPSSTAPLLVEPQALDGQAIKQRFADALSRSRNWR